MKKTSTALLLIALSLGGYAGFMSAFGKNIGVKERTRQVFFTHKFHEDRKYACVLAGDSRVYRGLNPDVFTKTLAKPTMNLGFDAAGFGPDFFAYVDEKLDLSAKDPVVVIGISAHSFTAQAAQNAQLVESRRLSANQINAILDPSSIEKYFRPFSLFQFPSIKDLIRNAPALDENVQEAYLMNGFAPAEVKINDPTAAVNSYLSVFRDQPYTDSAATVLIEKTRSYVQKGVRVFAVRLPTSKEMRAVEDQNSAFAEAEIMKRFTEAGGRWISMQIDHFDTIDGSHLNRKSADDASLAVALNIRQALNENPDRVPGSEH